MANTERWKFAPSKNVGGYEGKRRIICMTCEFYGEGYCCEAHSKGPHVEEDQCEYWKEAYAFYADCIDIALEESQNDFRRTFITPEEAKFIIGGMY